MPVPVCVFRSCAIYDRYHRGRVTRLQVNEKVWILPGSLVNSRSYSRAEPSHSAVRPTIRHYLWKSREGCAPLFSLVVLEAANPVVDLHLPNSPMCVTGNSDAPRQRLSRFVSHTASRFENLKEDDFSCSSWRLFVFFFILFLFVFFFFR